MTNRDGREELCTFCQKPRHRVRNMVAGPPGVNICSDCIEICSTIITEDRRKTGGTKGGAAGSSAKTLQVPSPRKIVEHLDGYVIGQESAKRAIAVAVYHHYQRIAQGGKKKTDVEIEKSNILLVGPTGCGKTLIAKSLAKLLDVPFAIGDATTLTEAGYVGEDVENLLLKLIQAAEGDIERAQRGIIFVDEIDKIARTTGNVSITRDVSGEGVQQSLLKMLEGTVSNVPPQGGRKHPEQQYIPVDTSNILFICGGTFVGLEEIISRRVGKARIGFESGGDAAANVEVGPALFHKVETEDFVHFGMIPEFLGRLPVVAVLDPLGEAELKRVLTEPKNALVKQFQAMFDLEGATLRFTDGALTEICRKAIVRKTGVRGLRAIMEHLLRDAIFSLPEVGKGAEYVVTEENVSGDKPVKARKPARKKNDEPESGIDAVGEARPA